jgi:CTP:molybdopterin cytidylyltransferase MocA
MAIIFSFTKPGPAKTAPAPIDGNLAQAGARDWSNQELSDIYRAVASLGQAGILVHMDRGQTDEGDPWLVLCRLDGEVFIHFCRLDGRYLLDSPALGRPLRGHSFAELIDLFITQASKAAAPNVVAFRASKVFLHPAALLTILVWSLYVWSSDTTHVEAGELDNGDLLGGLSPHALLAAEKLAAQSDAEASPPAAGKPVLLVDGTPADKLVNRLLQAVDHSGGMPAGNNIAAMQMLAVVGTLVLSGLGTQGASPEADTTSLVLLGDMLPEADARPVAPVDAREISAQGAWEGSTSAKALIAATEKLQAEAVAILPAEMPDVPPAVILAEIDQLALEGLLPPAPPLAPMIVSDANPIVAQAALANPVPETAVQLQAPTLVQELATQLGTALSLVHYNVGGLSLIASFDPTLADNLLIGGQADILFDAPQLAPQPPTPIDRTYDEAARAFITSFLAQSSNIQLIASARELVLIDLTAFDDTMDTAFAYSWTLGDGGVISTLGHYDFFASYALV